MGRSQSSRSPSSGSESGNSFNSGTTAVNPSSITESGQDAPLKPDWHRSGMPYPPAMMPTPHEAWILEDIEFRRKKWHLDPNHRVAKVRASSPSPEALTSSIPVPKQSAARAKNYAKDATTEAEEAYFATIAEDEAVRIALRQSRREYEDMMRRQREAEDEAKWVAHVTALASEKQRRQAEEEDRTRFRRRREEKEKPAAGREVQGEGYMFPGEGAVPWWKQSPEDAVARSDSDNNKTYAARVLHQQKERERELKAERECELKAEKERELKEAKKRELRAERERQEAARRAQDMEEAAIARAVQESIISEEARKAAARDAREKKAIELELKRMRLEQEVRAMEDKIRRKEAARFFVMAPFYPPMVDGPFFDDGGRWRYYPFPAGSARGIHGSDRRTDGTRQRRSSSSMGNIPTSPQTASGEDDTHATYADSFPTLRADKTNRRWSQKTMQRRETVVHWEDGYDRYKERTTSKTTTKHIP
ncbi:hypothetical protein VTJ49DRAFT_1733 [Mycothermus thermophilus]|uniref:Trichoplein multi-domain protein n=1 Tax=Humicola insolens TaxID=85995 RepID=A0ABR3VC57_HUMIN